MPYDPSFPPTNALLISAEFRAQFQALFDLIQSIPAGPQGPPGPSVAGAFIDGVNTLNPGDAAQVTTFFDGANVHFTFGIPRGQDGANGQVSFGDLANAISTTSSNSNAVDTLNNGFADPDMELMRAKINELILALRR